MLWLLLLLLMLLIPAIVAVGVWYDRRRTDAPDEPPGEIDVVARVAEARRTHAPRPVYRPVRIPPADDV